MDSIDIPKLVGLRNTLFDTQGNWVDLTVEEWSDLDKWISNIWATASKSVQGVPVTFDDRHQCLVKRMYRYCQDRRRGGEGHGKPSKPKQGIRNKPTLPFIGCKASMILIFRFHATTGEALGISVKTKGSHSHSLEDSDSRGNSFGIRGVSRQLMTMNHKEIGDVQRILQSHYSQVGGATISKHSIRASGRDVPDDKFPPGQPRIPNLSFAEMQRLSSLPYVPPQTADRPDNFIPHSIITYAPIDSNTRPVYSNSTPIHDNNTSPIQPPSRTTPKAKTRVAQPPEQNGSLAALLSNLPSARVTEESPSYSYYGT